MVGIEFNGPVEAFHRLRGAALACMDLGEVEMRTGIGRIVPDLGLVGQDGGFPRRRIPDSARKILIGFCKPGLQQQRLTVADQRLVVPSLERQHAA